MGEPGGTSDEVDRLCFRNLLDDPHDILYFKDTNSRYLRVSRGMAAALGVSDRVARQGESDADHYDSAHARRAFADEQQIMVTGEPMVDVEEHQTWPDRPDTWVSSTKMALRDAGGHVIGTFGISRDISRRVRAEHEAALSAAALAAANAELHRVEAELRTVLEFSPDSIIRYDLELRYLYLNPAALKILNLPAHEALGRTDSDLGFGDEVLDGWGAALRKVIATGANSEIELTVPWKTGGQRWFHSRLAPEFDASGAVCGVLAATRDLTELKQAESALAHQATHDPLTGLANRTLLSDRMARALLQLRRSPGGVAVLFVDLDRFKSVNDTYGHEVGDAVLIEVAARLTSSARRSDTVARLGGDEFVLLCHPISSGSDVDVVVRRVMQAFSVPVVVGDVRLDLSASIGTAMTSDPAADATRLLGAADAQMYVAKQDGGGGSRSEVGDAASGLV